MGLIISHNINDTIKYTKIKISELMMSFYDLTDDMRYILICTLVSHILALYVKDQISKGNSKIVNALHQSRNTLAHDYPTPTALLELNDVCSQDNSIRELCSMLNISMQQKSNNIISAINKNGRRLNKEKES